MKINPESRDLNYNNYLPGAHINIIPPESEERLIKINSVLNLSDKYLLIDKSHHFNIYSDLSEKFPHFKKLLQKGFLTYEEILKYVIDFDSVLKKSQTDSIKNLLKFHLINSEIFSKFEILFSKYTELILKNRVSLYDIISSLNLYKIKLNLSLSEIMESFPIKYPRSYSLLSYGYEKDTNPLEIVFSVVQDRIIRKFPNIKMNNLPNGFFPGEYYYKGQTSNFFKTCLPGDKILISEISNCFDFPLEAFLNDKKPIVYICNGTGIAPCISFIKEILNLISKGMVNPEFVGEFIILTGFRSDSPEKKETVYEDFITDSIETINYTIGKEVFTYLRCLSCMSENEEEEVGIWRNYRINTKYVQDLIIEHDEKIYSKLFTDEGYLMICGDIEKLYDECIANIMSVFMKKDKWVREQCVKYIEDMKIKGRMIIEKWM
jgi:sulfite reductase alpha subunit-like flavoprotein